MRIYTECDILARWFEDNTSSDVGYYDLGDFAFYIIEIKVTFYNVLVFFNLHKKTFTEDDLPF